MVSCQRLVRRGSTLLCLDCNLLTICFLTNVCWISHFLVPTKGSFPWQLTDVWPKAASHVDHFPIFMMHLFNFICSWNTGLTKDEMTWLQRLSAGSCSGRAVKCCCASTTAATCTKPYYGTFSGFVTSYTKINWEAGTCEGGEGGKWEGWGNHGSFIQPRMCVKKWFAWNASNHNPNSPFTKLLIFHCSVCQLPAIRQK